VPGRGRKPDRTTGQRRQRICREPPSACVVPSLSLSPLSRWWSTCAIVETANVDQARRGPATRIFREKPSARMLLIRYIPGRVAPGLVSHFCPTCGVTVCWTRETGSTRIGIPVGAFNDPSFPAPSVSFWEEARYEWSPPMKNVDHWDTQPPPPSGPIWRLSVRFCPDRQGTPTSAGLAAGESRGAHWWAAEDARRCEASRDRRKR
jgi:hypothetical protein